MDNIVNTTSSHDKTILLPLGNMGIMFYLVPPSIISTYEEMEDIPPYVELAVPFFILFILVEMIISYLRGIKNTYNYKDTLTSIASGTFQQVFGTFYKVLLIQPYLYVHTNYRLFDLPKGKKGLYLHICIHMHAYT